MALENLFFSGDRGGNVSPLRLNQPGTRTAGRVYMAKLGGYMFCLETSAPQQIERTTQYRWEAQNRIGRAPARQFTGLGEDTIELSGVIYPHFRGGLGQVGAMRAAAGRGEALPLVYAFDAIGQYCGLWCIVSVREGRTLFFGDGTPRKVEFSLSLAAYGEDAGASGFLSVVPPLAGVPAGAGAAGAALAGNAAAVAQAPAVTLASSLEVIRSVAGRVSDLSGLVSDVSSLSATSLLSALGGLGESGSFLPAGTMAAIKDLGVTAGAVIGASDDLKTAADAFREKPDQLKRALNRYSGDLRALQRDVVRSSSSVKSASSRLSALASDGGDDVGRLSCAAALTNASRAADALLFGCAAGADQSAALEGKIDA